MIRKVYLDFIKEKIAEQDLSWLLQRIRQYFLIHGSYLLGRPLCGPILGTFAVTYKCNYRCKMCELPLRDEQLRRQGLKELSTSQSKELLKDFAELGTSGIGFTGGEPLMRADIFELLRYTKDLGMISHLNTNGFFLDEKNTQNLVGSGCDSLNISLDGSCAQTHDAIRGFRGAFEAATRAIKCVSRKRSSLNNPIRIKAVCVINEMNIDELPDLIKLTQQLGSDCIEFIPQQPFVETTEPNKINFNQAFLEKVDNAVNYLLRLKSKGVKIENSPRHLKMFAKSFRGEPAPVVCFAGYNSLGVDCFGQLYPCMPWINWTKSVGNIKTLGLKQFWYCSQYNKVRREISRCKDCYLNCQAELNLLFNMLS